MGSINITSSMAVSIALIYEVMGFALKLLGIYTMILMIKALKIYINKNYQ